MDERARLEREIFELSRIIKTDTDVLAKNLCSAEDRLALAFQIETRDRLLVTLRDRLAALPD